jgi:hypothetical protein
MDPTTALANLRKALRTLRGDLSDSAFVDAVDDAADSFDALDGWLSRGGFLPEPWAANRPVPFTTGRMYAVAPTYERQIDEHTTRQGQVPTFYLHPDVQGILSEDQATRIARDILTAGTDPADGITYHVRAYEV